MDNIRNIINMSPFINDQKFPMIREVEGYWQALRAGRTVPYRSDLDPRGIEGTLEYAFIVERIAPGIARLRLAGSHLSDLMGMEVRGMPLSAFFTPDTRAEASEALELVFEGPATLEMRLDAERSVGKPAIDARLILLPMKSDLGDVSRALGCFATNGVIGRAPRRFGVTSIDIRALAEADRQAVTPAPRHDRHTAHESENRHPNSLSTGADRSDLLEGLGTDTGAAGQGLSRPYQPLDATPGMAEAAAPFSGAPGPASRASAASPAARDSSPERPYLRLVRSDDDEI